MALNFLCVITVQTAGALTWIGVDFDDYLHSLTSQLSFKTFNIFSWSSQLCCDI